MKPNQLLDLGSGKTYYLRKVHSETNSPSNALSKRAFDIALSALVIIFILSWLLPILALIIKIDSKGPVFFIQKRIGANGKIFGCLKLRSMYVNAQANTRQAATNDRRITRFGTFLRISCMDELPQFFNVLKGEMSIVGPRPHMLKDCEDFSNMVKNYNLRHQVKPGITGMAQVKGYRGETKDFYDVAHRYKWDIYYVKNNSFLLDLRIIHKTSVQTLVSVVKSSKKPKLSDHYVPAPAKEIKNAYAQLIES
jgi:putative colanic acid biosynthesis UDP-glucose lipid carrier transferase